MLKVRLNLRKMIAIAICLAGSATIFAQETGVEINGVTWATCNVDAPNTFAANPQDAGMFYQWNHKIGWSASDPLINSNGDTTWDTSYPTGVTWEKDNDPSPTGWRVPTFEELCKLKDEEKVTSEWVTQNGVLGKKFTDKDTGNSIFLPSAGRRFTSNGILQGADEGEGDYWSSTPEGGNDDFYAYFLYFRNDGFGYMDDFNGRRYGYSIRSVKNHSRQVKD